MPKDKLKKLIVSLIAFDHAKNYNSFTELFYLNNWSKIINTLKYNVKLNEVKGIKIVRWVLIMISLMLGKRENPIVSKQSVLLT